MIHRISFSILLLVVAVSAGIGQPKLTFNTSLVNFGNVRVGEISQLNQATLLITNSGTDTLRITSVSFTDPHFSINQSVMVIPPRAFVGDPQGSFLDTLHFVPAVPGADSAWMILGSNNPDSPDSLRVFGFGLAGDLVDPKTQAYRDDPLGDVQYRRQGIMDGNRVVTIFKNEGEIGDWPNQPSAVWPKGTNHSYLDGVGLLIAAKITAPGNGQTITPMISAYREEVSADPVTGRQWVLQPVPGYLNASPPVGTEPRPAVNIDPLTFPAVWPAALGLTPAWNGYWYGYFGRGVTNSDFETYFVMDDSQVKKFNLAPYKYFPILSDSSRGGLGCRVEARGFQWSHVLAEDIIFWHYDIVNISDHNYDSTCFGFYTDPGVGGTNNSGNSALFSRAKVGGQSLDMAYAWSTSGLGVPGNYKTGYMGYAYLESPGNAFDGIDNDLDGLVDERRDNNIDDDHDWIPFSDLNHNGKWDPGEPLNDDVGRDGVGPTDPQYTGPDEGEGDGIPTHGEPDFDETDIHESDMIGLNAVSIWLLADKTPSGGWPRNDNVMWGKMTNGFKDTTVQNTNISMSFSSGPFPWKQTKRERFSMALAFGDDLQGLIFNKETVQEIYNANYNFSKPPYKPNVTAVPGDKRVFLYWDAIAETSVDRFLGFEDSAKTQYKHNFEGYTIYRSEEPFFEDNLVITDAQGTPRYWKPMVQFDLVDSIRGPDPVGVNGAHFWRGSNSGLSHSFIDTTVSNGVKYYYAICSYSKGDPNRGTRGLQPTECSKVISTDNIGGVKFIDINCAVVTPQKPAAGYQSPQALGGLDRVAQGLGTGSLVLTILNPTQIQNGDQYTVKFRSNASIPVYRTMSFDILRSRDNLVDSVGRAIDSSFIGKDKYSPPFDGMVLSVVNDMTVAVNDSSTGWVVGTSNVRMRVAADNALSSKDVAWPADYELRFFDTVVDTTAFDSPPRYPQMTLNFTVTNTTSQQKVKCIVDDVDNSATLTVGDTIRIIDGFDDLVNNPGKFNITYKISYGSSFGTVRYPQAGDRFVIKTKRPFVNGDYFSFTMRASSTDNSVAKTQLNQITVVPNPYISTARWESRTLYTTGRGDRLIQFMKLPAKCTIRIFTVSGALVKTLHKDTAPTDGSLSWNLVSDDGMDVAFGLYIFHVDAPGIGEYIGKFALIK